MAVWTDRLDRHSALWTFKPDLPAVGGCGDEKEIIYHIICAAP